MYEDKMMRLKHEQKRLQEINSQNEDEVKAVSHLCNLSDELLIKAVLDLSFCYSCIIILHRSFLYLQQVWFLYSLLSFSWRQQHLKQLN